MDVTLARALLGVSPGAASAQVDQAFRILARQEHPDRGGDAGRFQLLVEARDLLRRSPPRSSTPLRSPAPPAPAAPTVEPIRWLHLDRVPRRSA
ncbi:MAG TPA: J domain-containing protein [Acidimicrobiales bacterium]|jgi:hypothetical protein